MTLEVDMNCLRNRLKTLLVVHLERVDLHLDFFQLASRLLALLGGDELH